MEPEELTELGETCVPPEKAFCRRLKKEEGLRLDLYLDLTGNKFIGYGHKVTGESYQFISKSQASEFLKKDIEKSIKSIKSVCAFHGVEFDKLPSGVQNALKDLCFQVGPNSLSDFVGFFKKIKSQDFIGAGLDLMNSRHATVFTCRCLVNYWMLHENDQVISEAGFKISQEKRKEWVCQLIKEVIDKGIFPMPRQQNNNEETKENQNSSNNNKKNDKLLSERITGKIEKPFDLGYIWQVIARNCYKHYEPYAGQNIEIEDLDLDLGDIGKNAMKELAKEENTTIDLEKENIKMGCFGPKIGIPSKFKPNIQFERVPLRELQKIKNHKAKSVMGDVDPLENEETLSSSIIKENISKIQSDDFIASIPNQEYDTKSEGETSSKSKSREASKPKIPQKIEREPEPGENNPIDVRKPFGRRVVLGFLVALSGEVNKMKMTQMEGGANKGYKGGQPSKPMSMKSNLMPIGSYRAGSMIGGALGGVLAHADEIAPTDMAKEVAKSFAVDATIASLAPTVAFTATQISAAAGSGAIHGITAGVGKAAQTAAPMVGNIVTGALLATNLAGIANSESLHIGEKWIQAGKSVLDVIVGMGAGMSGALVGAKLGAAVGTSGGPLGFVIGLGGGVVGGLAGGLATRLWNKPMRLFSKDIPDGKLRRNLCNFDTDFKFEWDHIPGNTKSFIILMAEHDGSLRWQIININPKRRCINIQNVVEGVVIIPYLGVAARDKEVTFQLWALDKMIPEGIEILEFAQKHVISVAQLKCLPE